MGKSYYNFKQSIKIVYFTLSTISCTYSRVEDNGPDPSIDTNSTKNVPKTEQGSIFWHIYPQPQ